MRGRAATARPQSRAPERRHPRPRDGAEAQAAAGRRLGTWAARRLLTARRRGCVDVLCAIEDDDDVRGYMVEIFTSGIPCEAALRADPTEPLARRRGRRARGRARREEGYDYVPFRRDAAGHFHRAINAPAPLRAANLRTPGR